MAYTHLCDQVLGYHQLGAARGTGRRYARCAVAVGHANDGGTRCRTSDAATAATIFRTAATLLRAARRATDADGNDESLGTERLVSGVVLRQATPFHALIVPA